jgi:hypothetical protein
MPPARPSGPVARVAAVVSAEASAAAAAVAALPDCSRLFARVSTPHNIEYIRDRITGGHTQVLLMGKHLLGLRRVQVLHGVGVRVASTWRHTTHEGGGIDLGPWPRHSHVPNQMLRHSGGAAGLTRVVSHAWCHGVAGRGARVLLHSAGMRRKGRAHASHHLRCCRLSTAWIST